MNSSTSKDFLLILSFPGYLKRPSIISSLLPSAISLSVQRLRVFCHSARTQRPPRRLETSRQERFHGTPLNVTGTTI